MKNEVQEKAFDFSIRIAELVSFLREDCKGFPLCERLLACGIETGLVCRTWEEGRHWEKKAKQAADLVIEADYIIEMAQVAGYLTRAQCIHIRAGCENLIRLLEDGRAGERPSAHGVREAKA